MRGKTWVELSRTFPVPESAPVQSGGGLCLLGSAEGAGATVSLCSGLAQL